MIGSTPYRDSQFKTITKALDLVASYDPRRFRRIQKFIRYIVLGAWPTAGKYVPMGKICGVRRRSDEEGGRNSVAVTLYACVLETGIPRG